MEWNWSLNLLLITIQRTAFISVWIASACYTRDKGLDFNFNILPIDSITQIKWYGEKGFDSSASDVGIACPDDY